MLTLPCTVPMVVNFLGKKVHEDGLDATKLSNLLTNERETIVAAAPPGFMNTLEGPPPTPLVEEHEVEIAAVPGDRRYIGDTHRERSGRWLWPAVGVAAALLA